MEYAGSIPHPAAAKQAPKAPSPISESDVIGLSQLLHWAKWEHYALMLTGSAQRNGRVERVLLRLVRKGVLQARHYQGRRKLYAARGHTRSRNPNLEHGLACSEALMRLWLGNPAAEIVGEKQFRSFKVVPDFGLVYPNGNLMLVECQTANKVYATPRKLALYDKHLPNIESHFQRSPFVLFVIDAPRQTVINVVARGPSPHYFVDSTTFLSVAYGRQLDEPIYILGTDGKSYPLRG